jgi:hypothetical protein
MYDYKLRQDRSSLHGKGNRLGKNLLRVGGSALIAGLIYAAVQLALSRDELVTRADSATEVIPLAIPPRTDGPETSHLGRIGQCTGSAVWSEFRADVFGDACRLTL